MARAGVRAWVRGYARFRGPADAIVPSGLLVWFGFLDWCGPGEPWSRIDALLVLPVLAFTAGWRTCQWVESRSRRTESSAGPDVHPPGP